MAEAGGTAGPATPEVPLGVLLASADVAAGQTVTKKCASCHNFGEGESNKTGPLLYGVVGRLEGSHEGFAYSAVLEEHKANGDVWSYENLNASHFAQGLCAGHQDELCRPQGSGGSRQRAGLPADAVAFAGAVPGGRGRTGRCRYREAGPADAAAAAPAEGAAPAMEAPAATTEAPATTTEKWRAPASP